MNLIQPVFEFDETAIVEGTVDVKDFDLAKTVGELLFVEYPDHAWHITANAEYGGVFIRNLALSSDYGITLHGASVEDQPTLRKKLRKLCGEFLEAFGVARQGYRSGDYNGHIEKARFTGKEIARQFK